MKRIVMLSLAFGMAGLSALGQQPHADTTPLPALSMSDQTTVQGLVNAFADAWNRHDMKAMHDLDTEDVQWVSVVGHYWQGKETVRKGHTAIHKGMVAKQSMSVESTTTHALTPDVAVVVATLHFSASTDPRFAWVLESKTRGSFTMVKRGGVWKIAQFQNTVVDPKTEHDDLPSFAETGFPPSSNPYDIATSRHHL